MSFLLDRMIKTKSKDAMHSSVYGQAQNDGAFGTSSVSSFEDRVKVEQNRQTIRKYSDAQLVNEVGRKEKIADMRERGSADQVGANGSNASGSGARSSGAIGSSVTGPNMRGDFGSRFDFDGQSGVNRSTNRGSSGVDSSTRNIPAGMRGASRVAPSTSSRPAPSRPPARRNPGIFR